MYYIDFVFIKALLQKNHDINNTSDITMQYTLYKYMQVENTYIPRKKFPQNVLRILY